MSKIGSARRDPCLEVPVGSLEDPNEVFDPGPDIVFALVPSSLRGVERVVIRILGVEHSLLDADVSGHLIALLKQRVRGQQARQPAVPVGDRMDREEVEDQRPDQEDRMGGLRRNRVPVSFEEVHQQELRFLGRRWRKEDFAVTVLVSRNQVLFRLEPSPAAVRIPEEQSVEVEDIRHAQGVQRRGLRDLIHRVSVSGEFSFVAVSESPRFGPFLDQSLDAARVDDYPFDGARSRD
jgi:hypothetical protein